MFPLDTTLFQWLHATNAPPLWLLLVARFASLELPSLLIAGIVGACVVGDAPVRRIVLRIAVSMLLAWMLARLGQSIWPGERPFALGLGTAWITHGNSPGFPSTHASVASAVALSLVLAGVARPVAALALALAGLIGWSRIYLGVHFPSEVAAGLLVGAIAALVALRLPRGSRLPRAAHVHE